jgi:glycosyltransferase involved in cell wall biosynthesis
MRKGVDVLLQAAAILRDGGLVAKGYVVGDGEDEASLARMRDELGLGERVLFAGYRPDARALMAEFDVFVIPSRNEGLPVALLEAMALEKPIVSTAVGGIPEVLEHERSGLLVHSERPNELAAAIRRLLEDRSLAERLGKEAARVVRARFTSEKVAEQLLRVYREVVSR